MVKLVTEFTTVSVHRTRRKLQFIVGAGRSNRVLLSLNVT